MSRVVAISYTAVMACLLIAAFESSGGIRNYLANPQLAARDNLIHRIELVLYLVFLFAIPLLFILDVRGIRSRTLLIGGSSVVGRVGGWVVLASLLLGALVGLMMVLDRFHTEAFFQARLEERKLYQPR
jgi:hypothetical protein